MPSQAAHLAAAAENQKAIDYLAQKLEDFSGWAVTVAFYKALHLVEALFAADGAGNNGHTDDHRDRNQELKTNQRYQHIWRHYNKLWQASRIARYLRENNNAPTYDVFTQYMPVPVVRNRVLHHYLVQVENSVRKLMNS
jgi:hypothetical protein